MASTSLARRQQRTVGHTLGGRMNGRGAAPAAASASSLLNHIKRCGGCMEPLRSLRFPDGWAGGERGIAPCSTAEQAATYTHTESTAYVSESSTYRIIHASKALSIPSLRFDTHTRIYHANRRKAPPNLCNSPPSQSQATITVATNRHPPPSLHSFLSSLLPPSSPISPPPFQPPPSPPPFPTTSHQSHDLYNQRLARHSNPRNSSSSS
jgi:hypothetical protein